MTPGLKGRQPVFAVFLSLQLFFLVVDLCLKGFQFPPPVPTALVYFSRSLPPLPPRYPLPSNIDTAFWFRRSPFPRFCRLSYPFLSSRFVRGVTLMLDCTSPTALCCAFPFGYWPFMWMSPAFISSSEPILPPCSPFHTSSVAGPRIWRPDEARLLRASFSVLAASAGMTPLCLFFFLRFALPLHQNLLTHPALSCTSPSLLLVFPAPPSFLSPTPPQSPSLT